MPEEIIIKGMIIQGEIGVTGDKIDMLISGFAKNYKGTKILIGGQDITNLIRKIVITAEVGYLPKIELEMFLSPQVQENDHT